jgi:hypothetical protein
MLTQLFPFLDPIHIMPDLASRLRGLADDCDRLNVGGAVSPILLQSAPLLEDWVPAVTPEGLQLIGHASSHPIHGDRMVMTTQVWFADPDGNWIRTLSRFYRLGPPADPENIHRILTSVATGGDDDGTEDEV